MRGFTYLSKVLHSHSSYSKLLVLCSVSTGGLLVYAESNVESGKQVVEQNQPESKKKRVVVLGTGWGGTSFLKDVDISSYDVQVVSPRNYFAFTPLLPSVTCGTVEARSIVEPVRNIIKKRSGEIQFWEAECLKIDPENRTVSCRSGINDNLAGHNDFSLQYDYLVVAVGAQVNTFNTPGVMEHCHFLKIITIFKKNIKRVLLDSVGSSNNTLLLEDPTLTWRYFLRVRMTFFTPAREVSEVEDAQRIRRTVIDCFEKSVIPGLSEEERRTNLHFVIVGGGPTGVEFAAELHDYVYEDLVKIYPSVKDFVKITVIQSGDHILNTFDERISSFAEQKFQRDGIEVSTGCRVTSVSDHFINMKVKSTGKHVEVPYGMVVWSTGVGTRPFVKDFMEQVGQEKRRILATDEWLRVKGCSNVYALGDCASIDQRKVMEDISTIFKAADKDDSGTLSVEEFQDVLEDIIIRYPQVDLYLKNKHLLEAKDLFKDSEGNEREEVDIEGFKLALSHVDSQMKSLPATAQVAAQQGTYLARCLNRWDQCKSNPEGPRRFKSSGRHEFLPFEYRHLGQFAPLGGDQAAAELPGDWVSMGHSTQWLWYSVYASKQVSWRTRYLVVGDWVRRYIFGRDSSRI